MKKITYSGQSIRASLELPASKSIYNRARILQELYLPDLVLQHSDLADDSLLLNDLLISDSPSVDCKNAGTVLRFLLSFYALKGKTVSLFGNRRMQERPVGELVQALNSLGATIIFEKKGGFPPVHIYPSPLKGGEITVDGRRSSQFITSLLLIAPGLPEPLRITMDGTVSSAPYIDMTVKLMRSLGFDIQYNENELLVFPFHKRFLSGAFHIENDWSSAAFWFELTALSSDGEIRMKNMEFPGLQGDSVLMEMAPFLGLYARISDGDLILSKKSETDDLRNHWDLKSYPDLAPALIVAMAARKQNAVFSGLESLKIKESDRTLALQTELAKCGVRLDQHANSWILDSSDFRVPSGTVFSSWDDHRIAMALAPLALFNPVFIENAGVTEKSYPAFWEHLASCGFIIENA